MSAGCSIGTADHGEVSSGCASGLECPGGPVTQVANDVNVSGELAVTSTTLYWVDRGGAIVDSIQAAPVGGGAPSTFYAAQDTTIAIEAIAADGTDVYWTEVSPSSDHGYTSSLMAMSRSGNGGPRVLASSPPATTAFFGVAVDATDVYYTVESTALGGGGGLERVPIGGGPVDPVVASTDSGWVGTVTAGATGVYWIEQSSDGGTYTRSLRRLAPGATQIATLTSATVSLADANTPVLPEGPIAVSRDAVAWVGSDGSVSSVPVVGGDARILLGADANAVFLAASPSDVFVIGAGPQRSGVLRRVPLDGSPATTIASGMGVAGGFSAYQGVVADATSVYWAGVDRLFEAAQ